MTQLKDAPRGTWVLCRAYDAMDDLERLRRRHAAEQRKKPVARRTPFEAPTELIAEKAGYIVWKDSKLVVFYTNNLAKTPSKPILDGLSKEAIECVHGLAAVHH